MRPISLNSEYMVLLQEFKTGMMDHPVTAKIMREKTLDSLLATMWKLTKKQTNKQTNKQVERSWKPKRTLRRMTCDKKNTNCLEYMKIYQAHHALGSRLIHLNSVLYNIITRQNIILNKTGKHTLFETTVWGNLESIRSSFLLFLLKRTGFLGTSPLHCGEISDHNICIWEAQVKWLVHTCL